MSKCHILDVSGSGLTFLFLVEIDLRLFKGEDLLEVIVARFNEGQVDDWCAR